MVVALLLGWSLCVGPARGAEVDAPARMSIELGWGGLYRSGEWCPLYVTLGGAALPAEGVAEVRAFQDSRSTVILTAAVPLQPGRATFMVPMLMGTVEEGASVTVRDTATGRAVATARVADLPAAGRVAIAARGTGAGTTARLVVVAGGAGAAAGGVGPGDLLGIDVPMTRLPRAGELYESVDLLVLNRSTLAEVSPEQAAAMLAWVRSGGKLMVCVPSEGLQPGNALEGMLPGRVGGLRSYGKAPGGTVTGRELRANPDAMEVQLGDGAVGVMKDVGLGRVYELPYPLMVETRGPSGTLLGVLRPRLASEAPRIAEARGTFVLNVGMVLLAVGLLMGPVEAVVRRAHDQWPWKWWVVGGVGLAVAGGALALMAPRGGIDIAPMRLVDQTETESVAETRIGAAIPGVGGPALVRVIEPLHRKTTEHAAVRLRLHEQLCVLESEHRDAALVTSRYVSGPALVVAAGWEGRTVTLASEVEWAAVDGPNGTLAGVRGAGGTWTFEGRPSSAGSGLADARRLTPTRTFQLQGRVAAGEGLILWTRTGTTYTRTFLAGRR